MEKTYKSVTGYMPSRFGRFRKKNKKKSCPGSPGRNAAPLAASSLDTESRRG